MAVTREDVEHVAQLARLRLDEAEIERYREDLAAILGYIEQLDELDTSNVGPMAHPLPLRNVLRADEPRPSLPVGDALGNAPQRDGDFFGVPSILDV